VEQRDVKAISEHLFRRGSRGTLYLRRRIPTDLRGAFAPGKREVMRSLRTSDETVARRRAAYRYLGAVVRASELQAKRHAGKVRTTTEVAPPPSQAISWQEVFATWPDYVHERPKTTTLACQTAWRALEAFRKSRDVLWPAHVTPALMTAFVDHMRSQGLSSSSRSPGLWMWRFGPAQPASTCRACARTAASASLEKGWMAPESSRCPSMPAPVATHDARADQHVRPRASAAADLVHRLRLGLRVELVDQGHAGAGLHVGDAVQAQGPCAQLSDPVTLPFGPPEVQQGLERAAPALAMTLGQPRDRDAGRVFVIARAQGVYVHG